MHFCFNIIHTNIFIQHSPVHAEFACVRKKSRYLANISYIHQATLWDNMDIFCQTSVLQNNSYIICTINNIKIMRISFWQDYEVHNKIEVVVWVFGNNDQIFCLLVHIKYFETVVLL